MLGKLISRITAGRFGLPSPVKMPELKCTVPVEKTKNSAGCTNSSAFVMLKMLHLPSDTTEEEVRRFFGKHKPVELIFGKKDIDAMRSVIARFSNEDTMKTALEKCHQKFLRTCRIKLIPASGSDYTVA
ncbi:MAG: RNA-binding protein [Candidatus Pacebacteria bacterium]|nr:RNA-binding protein [Candidatus Paceibacterota bacterium]